MDKQVYPLNIHQSVSRCYAYWQSKKERISVRNNISSDPVCTLIGKVLMKYFPEELKAKGKFPLEEECPEVFKIAKLCQIPLVVLLEDIYYGDTLNL